MAFVHTPHGVGEIVATDSVRGRTQHRVAGRGWTMWVDATQCRTAEAEGELFSRPFDKPRKSNAELYGGDAESIEHFAANTTYDLGDASDRSTTLPYRPEPQYPTDMFSGQATILPGDQEIDPDARLNSSDSRSFTKRSPEHTYPGPNPDLFAKKEGFYRPPGLTNKYAYIHAPGGDDSVSRFRRDPVQEINRFGYLVTGGRDVEGMRDYVSLVETDAMIREAAWTDVRKKAQRLRHEGRIRVLEKTPNTIYANVQGDDGDYTVMLTRTGGQSVGDWVCSCDWGRSAFQRKMSHVGRLCSHGYASYLELGDLRTAASVEDFKNYVRDFRYDNVDRDAADNYITLPDHDKPLTDDQVADIYDYVDNNPSTRKIPDWKKTAEALRTQPQSFTPHLVQVESDGPNEFVDVTKDERDSTAPEGIQRAAYVDAMGNAYYPQPAFFRSAAPADDSLVNDVFGVNDEAPAGSLESGAAGAPDINTIPYGSDDLSYTDFGGNLGGEAGGSAAEDRTAPGNPMDAPTAAETPGLEGMPGASAGLPGIDDTGVGSGAGEGLSGDAYTVQEGDTLSDISQATYGDPNRYQEIARRPAD